MARKYAAIWAAIKAAPVGQEVPIKVHGTYVRTVRQAVLKEKCREVAMLKKLGLLTCGNLVIRVVDTGVTPTGYAIIYFKKDWDGNLL